MNDNGRQSGTAGRATQPSSWSAARRRARSAAASASLAACVGFFDLREAFLIDFMLCQGERGLPCRSVDLRRAADAAHNLRCEYVLAENYQGGTTTSLPEPSLL
eukprot:2385734-Prymnesium_polylepis.2